jgi:hypothetical protein
VLRALSYDSACFIFQGIIISAGVEGDARLSQAIIVLLSALLYGGLIYVLIRHRQWLDFRGWPPHPTLRRIWFLWLLFLAVLAPMAFNSGDMSVWSVSMLRLLDGQLLPEQYVYLPVYAQVLAAVFLPFKLLGLVNAWTVSYVIHIPILLAYVYSAKLMGKAIPDHASIAPLAIVLAPVTLFYILFGTNHIVMWVLLLAALLLLRANRPFAAGIFAVLCAYKLLLIPTLGILGIILLSRTDLRKVGAFVLGGIVGFMSSALYYVGDPSYFSRALSSLGAIGYNSDRIESFHFLYPFREIPGFEVAYVHGKLWFIVVVIAIIITVLLFVLRSINALQALALVSGVVTVAAPEPFRMEPVVGLLWLDAVYRRDLRLQTAVFFVLFMHGAAWLFPAKPEPIVFIDGAERIWELKGFLLGLAIFNMLGAAVLAKSREDWLLDTPPEQALTLPESETGAYQPGAEIEY